MPLCASFFQASRKSQGKWTLRKGRRGKCFLFSTTQKFIDFPFRRQQLSFHFFLQFKQKKNKIFCSLSRARVIREGSSFSRIYRELLGKREKKRKLFVAPYKVSVLCGACGQVMKDLNFYDDFSWFESNHHCVDSRSEVMLPKHHLRLAFLRNEPIFYQQSKPTNFSISWVTLSLRLRLQIRAGDGVIWSLCANNVVMRNFSY